MIKLPSGSFIGREGNYWISTTYFEDIYMFSSESDAKQMTKAISKDPLGIKAAAQGEVKRVIIQYDI